MNSFLQTNKGKCLRILIRGSIIILFFILIVLLIAFLNQSLPDLKTILLILFFGCFIFPVGLISFSVIIGMMLQNKKRQVYESLELYKIGFVDREINLDKFWEYNETIKTKTVDNYIINAKLSETHHNQLEIEIPLKWRQVDKSEFNNLENQFKTQDIELRIGSIVKQYDIKNLLLNYDFKTLETDIFEFITLTKMKGFDPKL